MEKDSKADVLDVDVDFRNSSIGTWFFLILGIIATLSSAGVYFGWGSITSLFQNEKVYFNLCEDDNDEIVENKCNDQLARIQLLFTLGTFMFSISSIPIGIFLDKYGRSLSMAVGFFTCAVGAFLIAITPPQSRYTRLFCNDDV